MYMGDRNDRTCVQLVWITCYHRRSVRDCFITCRKRIFQVYTHSIINNLTNHNCLIKFLGLPVQTDFGIIKSIASTVLNQAKISGRSLQGNSFIFHDNTCRVLFLITSESIHSWKSYLWILFYTGYWSGTLHLHYTCIGCFFSLYFPSS